ncbi:MAG: hypothetical protein LAP40_08515 [Acidobacteriia bacterium]|nr:hypothetical protein [Terriglobia bacterium]
MKRNLRNSLLALSVMISTSLVAYGAPSGAIFTTIADGTIVNANTQYTSKCAVYLDGGPGQNAPAKAAGLPAGDYFFQVTDPSGQTLLSTDVVSNRRFHVSADGVITAYTGIGGPVHPTGSDQVHPELGAITISLANTSCPADYLNTPNNGGVYKAWVTPVTSFVGDSTKVDNTCGNGCYHGFLSSASKTDNFKVAPTLPTFCLTITKQLIDQFGGVSQGTLWPVALTDPDGVTNNFFTSDTDGSITKCGLVAGAYTVTEDPQGLDVVGLVVNGVNVTPPDVVYSFSWSVGKPNPMVVVFQNFNNIPQ